MLLRVAPLLALALLASPVANAGTMNIEDTHSGSSPESTLGNLADKMSKDHAGSGEKLQKLKMTVVGNPTRVCPGKEIDIVVSYDTSDFETATAVSFKVQWNKEQFEVADMKDTAKIKSCGLRYFDTQFHEEYQYISFLCASMMGQDVVPPKIGKMMTARLKTLPNVHEGEATIAVIANPGLPGSGYTYSVSAPVHIDINAECDTSQDAESQDSAPQAMAKLDPAAQVGKSDAPAA